MEDGNLTEQQFADLNLWLNAISAEQRKQTKLLATVSTIAVIALVMSIIGSVAACLYVVFLT